MQLYFAYVNPKIQDVRYLKEHNFSFMAAFFNVLWALYHRLWVVALATFIITLIFNMQDYSYLSYDVIIVLKLTVTLVFGFFADDLQQYSLYRKGYILDDIILSSSELEAQKEYLSRSINN